MGVSCMVREREEQRGVARRNERERKIDLSGRSLAALLAGSPCLGFGRDRRNCVSVRGSWYDFVFLFGAAGSREGGGRCLAFPLFTPPCLAVRCATSAE